MAEIDERMEKQQYEMQTLNEEKQMLEKEYKRIPNPVVSFNSYIHLPCLQSLFRKKLESCRNSKQSVMISEMKTERRVHEMSSIRDEIEQKAAVIKEIQVEVVSLII